MLLNVQGLGIGSTGGLGRLIVCGFVCATELSREEDTADEGWGGESRMDKIPPLCMELNADLIVSMNVDDDNDDGKEDDDDVEDATSLGISREDFSSKGGCFVLFLRFSFSS